MYEKGVRYSAETVGTGAFVGLDSLMHSWRADEETIGIALSGMIILVMAGVVIKIVQVIKNKKSGEKRERFEDRANAKLDNIAEVV